jgi:hypothetical protein
MSEPIDGEWCHDSDATERLGVSLRTLQRQVEKGKRPSRQIDGKRHFWVATAECHCRDNDVTLTRQVSSPTQDALVEQLQGEVGRQAAQIAYLQSELTAQRELHTGEIARRDVAEAELRQIVATAQQAAIEVRRQLEALRAIAPPAQETVDAGQDGQSVERRPWWKFWRKQTG